MADSRIISMISQHHDLGVIVLPILVMRILKFIEVR